MIGAQAKFETAADAPGLIILLQEYNHRMLNHYAVAIAGLSIAASSIASPRDRAALDVAKDRLFAIAEMHRALQAPLTGVVEMSGYIENVCAATSQALNVDCQLTLRGCSQNIVLSAARAWRIGLILVELLTNAAKHGQACRGVAVEIRTIDQHLVCSVVNEACFAAKAGSGAGHAIVEILAGQIDGRLERRVDGSRVAVGLVVPMERPIQPEAVAAE